MLAAAKKVAGAAGLQIVLRHGKAVGGAAQKFEPFLDIFTLVVADEEDSFEILTAPADFDAVYKALSDNNIAMASAEVTMIPQTYVSLTDENAIKCINRILDLLDEDDDVQAVYHNWDE